MADDDITLNLGKFFGKKTPEEHHPEHHAENAPPADKSIDAKQIGSWFWKHRSAITVIVLLLSVILLSHSIRTVASNVPLADDWGRNQVYNFIHQDIAQAYQLQYPNLPDANKNKLIEQEFQKVLQQPTYTIKTGGQAGQNFNIKDQLKQTSDQFRSFFQYEANGRQYTYMPDIDPYTFLRWARNYLQTGDIADERRNGLPYDNHMVAPLGESIEATLHPYVLAWTYRVLSVFNPKITLMQAVTYFPTIGIAFAIIPLFFIARRLGGNAAGFFAALMFAVNIALLGRTNWGHADTDVYNVLFPLYTMWCFFEAYFAKSWITRTLLASTAGFFVGMFAFAWSGWWYIFDFILAVGGVYLVYLLWVHRNVLSTGIKNYLKHPDFTQHLAILLTFVVASGIFVSAFVGFTFFRDAPLAPFDFMSIKDAAKISLFPNVLTTVAELNEASLNQVVEQMGRTEIGRIRFFVIAIIGLLLLALPRGKLSRNDWIYLVLGLIWYLLLLNKIESVSNFTVLILFMIPIMVLMAREAFRGQHLFDLKLSLFLAIWFVATMYASTKGIRFVMLLVPAFSIAFGVAVGLLSDALGNLAHRFLRLSPKITFGLLCGIFAILMIAPVQTAYAAARNDLPIINDGWYTTLTSIKEASQPSAIITSWWDFGHHFKYYADRRVTFDGASQNEPMAHWVGKILLTNDEQFAVGLLRMLDCGSNKAFDTLDSEVNDASVTVKMIYDTVKLSKTGAAAYLKDKKITQTTIDKYLGYTHCEPPEAFFIASADMIGKAGVWAHFGSWDFDRADIWVFARNMPRAEGIAFIEKNSNVSEAEATQLYDQVKAITTEPDGNAWIAPWPNYNGDFFGCNRNNNTFNCGGITYDLATHNVTMQAQGQTLEPSSFTYPTAAGVTTVTKNNDNPFGLTFLPYTNNEYFMLLSQTPLSGSMFTRMYYYQGYGLKYFKPFNAQRDANGGTIYTYKVDWNGTSPTLDTIVTVPELV